MSDSTCSADGSHAAKLKGIWRLLEKRKLVSKLTRGRSEPSCQAKNVAKNRFPTSVSWSIRPTYRPLERRTRRVQGEHFCKRTVLLLLPGESGGDFKELRDRGGSFVER